MLNGTKIGFKKLTQLKKLLYGSKYASKYHRTAQRFNRDIIVSQNQGVNASILRQRIKIP
jgi:hypothetical protein